MRIWKVVGGLAALTITVAACDTTAPTSPMGVEAALMLTSGPGEVTVGVDASEWSSDTPKVAPLYPVGGSGQLNGEFTLAERLGIQIGLRAQERFVGPISATANRNGKVGIYEADTGESSTGRAKWNFDLHIDLRGAKGVAKGTDLSDYVATLETDIATGLFGFPVPLDLTFGGAFFTDAVLLQQSWNPTFGNTEFDLSVPGTYRFRVVLTPKTFKNPSLSVEIEVNVS